MSGRRRVSFSPRIGHTRARMAATRPSRCRSSRRFHHQAIAGKRAEAERERSAARALFHHQQSYDLFQIETTLHTRQPKVNSPLRPVACGVRDLLARRAAAASCGSRLAESSGPTAEITSPTRGAWLTADGRPVASRVSDAKASVVANGAGGKMTAGGVRLHAIANGAQSQVRALATDGHNQPYFNGLYGSTLGRQDGARRATSPPPSGSRPACCRARSRAISRC